MIELFIIYIYIYVYMHVYIYIYIYTYYITLYYTLYDRFVFLFGRFICLCVLYMVMFMV